MLANKLFGVTNSVVPLALKSPVAVTAVLVVGLNVDAAACGAAARSQPGGADARALDTRRVGRTLQATRAAVTGVAPHIGAGVAAANLRGRARRATPRDAGLVLGALHVA